MQQPWYKEGQYVIVVLIVMAATSLYGVGVLTDSKITPVEPQSIFTLYGAVLGYLFGSREKKRDQDHIQELIKETQT